MKVTCGAVGLDGNNEGEAGKVDWGHAFYFILFF